MELIDQVEEWSFCYKTDFKNTYGSPVVIVRDMAKGIKLGAAKVFPNASQQICQIHFLSDLEKDLITEYHNNLKNSIVRHKLTSKFKALRNENSGSGVNEIKKIQDRWIHIAVDHLLHPIEKHVKWIRRPIAYFIQYRRIKEVYDLVKRLISCNASNNFVHKPLMELYASLKSVLEDSRVFEYFCVFEKILQWLDKLRDHLRITRENNLKDSLPTGIKLEEVLTEIKEVLLKIRMESWKLGKSINKLLRQSSMLLKVIGKSCSFLNLSLMGKRFHSDAIITNWRAVIAEQEKLFVSVLADRRPIVKWNNSEIC
jgi:hypothetical protein